MKLIELFSTVLESAGVMYPDEDEEGDFVVKLAKLVCVTLNMVCNLDVYYHTTLLLYCVMDPY